MKDKRVLIAGIFLLTLGIILRVFSTLTVVPIALVLLGSGFKIFYLISLIKLNYYNPGYELILLVIGLALFFVAIYLRQTQSNIPYMYFMLPGIFLKMTFVISLIKAIKKNKT